MEHPTADEIDQMREEAWNQARSLSIGALKDRIEDFEAHAERVRGQLDQLQGELNGLIWKLPGDALDGADLEEDGSARLRTTIETHLGSGAAEQWDELLDERERMQQRHVSVCVRGTALQKQLALRLERYGAESAPAEWSKISTDHYESLPVGEALRDRDEGITAPRSSDNPPRGGFSRP